MDTKACQVLKYSIYKCSSFSSTYVPENILDDKPNDQSSRWSSDSNNPPQYLILKLEVPAIIKEILFGKYEKTHVCNLKKFKIYGGLEEKSMIELLDSGLKNDSQPEIFTLRHSIKNECFPCRYIKIVPIQSWGPIFNFSIWHIKLFGNNDAHLVKESLIWFNEYREREAVRLCLKHFRQHNYMEAFEALKIKTQIELEDELLTRLHRLLVTEGDYDACEALLEESLERGLFNEYLRKQIYNPKWSPIIPAVDSLRPGMRGGHQMCIDPLNEIIYLFGGWDGSKDLSDLWCYNLQTKEWNCLSKNTADEGGPSARSCHRMCLDYQRKKMFVLGRYPEHDTSCHSLWSGTGFQSDFYVYDTEANKWQLITNDTWSMGGPKLLYDHQMCFDIDKNIIYVFGGRIYSPPASEEKKNSRDHEQLSGLYAYHVSSNTWKLLREDISAQPSGNIETIVSRTGHSMLFHSKLRLLFIFGGQRQRDTLRDFFTYNVDTNETNHICDGDRHELPAAGFAQKATIDNDLNEIHVLCGINREKDKRSESIKNSFWVYDISQNRWSCIYRNEESSESSALIERSEPRPRYAHQLVYDNIKKIHYLFGGNPGRSSLVNLRLDDFWSLELSRLESKELLRNCKKLIRELHFKEKILDNVIEAVCYLQSDLSDTFDHSNPIERNKFQLLASLLFKENEKSIEYYPEFKNSHRYFNRTKLFDALVEYFPESMTQPTEDLSSLITF